MSIRFEQARTVIAPYQQMILPLIGFGDLIEHPAQTGMRGQDEDA